MTSPETTPLRYAAFTDDPTGGNPAGVVLVDALPGEDEMQRIAAEVGFSETAFVAPSAASHHDIRYFSPEREVTFCGHATIATAVAMAERDPDLTAVVLATRTDRVPVTVERRGGRLLATLTSPPASHAPIADGILDAVLDTFGWTRDDLDPDLPPAIASAGATHPIIPLASRRSLVGMTYRFDGLKRLMLDHGWTTVDVVRRESEHRFRCRNAFAVGGVVEDPATGAAAAALGGYLRDAGYVTAPCRLTVMQGAEMGRPSRIVVDVPADRPTVEVSGEAVAMR